MIQHQGQHPPEDTKGEGRKAAEEGESWRRGKSQHWGEAVFAPLQKNFNRSCNVEATPEKPL